MEAQETEKDRFIAELQARLAEMEDNSRKELEKKDAQLKELLSK